MSRKARTNEDAIEMFPLVVMLPKKVKRRQGVLYEQDCVGGFAIHKARDWETDPAKCHRKTVSEIFYRALRAVMYRHGCNSMAVTQAIHEIENELRKLWEKGGKKDEAKD